MVSDRTEAKAWLLSGIPGRNKPYLPWYEHLDHGATTYQVFVFVRFDTVGAL